MKPELDDPSGRLTTGHEWDGLKELDGPVPRAFSVWLRLSIGVAVLLWLLYPSWPFINNYSKGIAGYSSRQVITTKIAQGEALRAQQMPEFAELDVNTLAADPTLEAKYSDAIGVLYRDNCAACHGRDLVGQTNFPNLTDDHWLWSRLPEEIEYTLQVGINHIGEETRWAQMPAFGAGVLERADLQAVVEYVLSISGSDHDLAQVEQGSLVFEENCAACHNDGGTGGYENGAPSLVDKAWIYGGSRDVLTQTLRQGRQGVMPGWSGRLTDEDIKKLTLYVLWASQDKD